MKKRFNSFVQTLPGAFLVLALIGIMFLNSITSQHEIESQATSYLDQTSDRAAEELEKNFIRQEESMQTMAHMISHIMDYERIDTASLIHLTEDSCFDGIEYIHPSGGCYGLNEKSWDVKEKEYFQDAVQQHSGYAYDYEPERFEEGCIVFYAPIVSDKGDFYGVLQGYLTEKTIENMLDVSFWGHSTAQYLCTPDGTIISSNDQEERCDNILDLHKKDDCITDAEREKLTALFQAKNGNFQYTHMNNTVLGSISDIADGKFVFVETFPPEVLSELTAPALRKMHVAVVAVFVSLFLYGIVMLFISKKAKKRLEEENLKVNELLKGAEELSNRDELTGLYNRRGMMAIVDSPNIQERQRAILEIDIDNFKQINDNFGHQVGDELLKKLADLLKKTFRKEDIIVRIGGDELLVVMPNIKLEQADIVKKKISIINKTLQNPIDGLPVASISAGVAFSRPGEKDELLIRADKALYKMKEKGRCGCCVYAEEFK